MKVLIVDDERTALKNLSRVLSKVTEDASVYMADQVEEALKLCREFEFDIVFLDINMPDKDGLTLAKEMKEIRPMINIVIVTAYPEHALEAYKLYVSDYITKPVIKEDLKNALCNLRYPVLQNRKGLYVQCFGSFKVTFDGEAVIFGREKTKELFAFLIDRKGAQCTNAQIRAALWGDRENDHAKQSHYLAQITYELRAKLEELGVGDVFVHSRNSYAVIPEKIPCDYYQALGQSSHGLAGYDGEYMSQYEWAETRVGILNEEYMKKNR